MSLMVEGDEVAKGSLSEADGQSEPVGASFLPTVVRVLPGE